MEHFGGELGVLSYPQHGKPAKIKLCEPRGPLFQELPNEFQARPLRGRYVPLPTCHARGYLHSLGFCPRACS